MNNDELETQLNSIQTPVFNLPGHQETLKSKLFSEGFPENKGVVQTIKQRVSYGLSLKQPVWKIGSISLGATALAVILSFLISSAGSDSVYAKAMDIIEYGQTLRKTINFSDNRTTYSVNINGSVGIVRHQNDGSVIIHLPVNELPPDFYDGQETEIKVGKYDKSGESIYFDTVESVKLRTIKVGDAWVIEIVIQDEPR